MEGGKNMKDNLAKKWLVLTIILLFVGANVVPICNAYMDTELNYQINQPDAKDNSYAAIADIPPIFTGKNWTWLFYDDEDFNNAFEPLEDFTEEAYSGENLDVIVLQDTNYGPAKIWYINENHEHVLLEEWGEVDMGDSQTLEDFLEYGKTNYPATRYILSMYDHGNAWKGACIDDTNGGWLTMNDMQQALTNTNGVDIICFTAPCGMGALESAYELRDCVDVCIGSEASSGYGHWRGTIAAICNMMNNNPDLSIIEIGEQIIQLIENNTIWPDSVTMSAVRTDQLEELANSIDTIAHDFINNFNESFGNVWSVYGNVQSFGNGYVIDTYDFAEECLLVETNQSICQHLENIMNHVSEVVIAECHGNEYPDANGLNIYFPYPPEYSYDSRYADPDYELDFSQITFWDEFLIDYLYTVFYATQDIPISNSGIINNYTATMHSCDLLVNVYEGVTEMESKGKPSNRYSYLEHKWTIDATGGYESYVFYLEAYHTANSEGDDFIFAYSTDDTTYTDMVTVTKTTDNNTYQTFTLPDTLSGIVYIRVKDGDQTKGNKYLDTIYIDHMYIEAISEQDSSPPVISNVASSDITYNSVRITWDTDEPSNSKVNYDTTTPPTSTKSDSSMVTSHTITLTDLLPETTYYYEVQSTDIKGNTAIDNNSGTFYTFTTGQEPSNVMHVYSIDMWYEPVKNRFKIFTKVKIVDSTNNPVEGATVYIETTLPNGVTISFDDVVDSSGFVTFVYGPTPKSGTYISTVTNVAKDGWTYNPDENVETSESMIVP